MNDMRRMKKDIQTSPTQQAKSAPVLIRILWGVFLLLLLVLPVLNHLVQAIPLRKIQENGILVWYSKDLFTTLAVIANGAMIIRMFQVYRFSIAEDHKAIWDKTLNAFGFSLLALVTYLALTLTLRDQLSSLRFGQSNPQQLYLESILLVLYILFFCLVCRGFYLLGVRYISINKKLSPPAQ